uniref:Uncharacterized protein n=1 Tax=Anopheles minimus TaxID=112268 RepID=A0A182WQG8_9DIPT
MASFQPHCTTIPAVS